jgi:hypothetical protein
VNGLWILAALAAIVGILLAAQSLARLGVPGESSPPITAARTTGVAIGSNFGGIPPVLPFAPGTATMSESKLRAFLVEQGCGDPTCLLTDKSPTSRCFAGLDPRDPRRTARPERRSAAPVQWAIATGQEIH